MPVQVHYRAVWVPAEQSFVVTVGELGKEPSLSCKMTRVEFKLWVTKFPNGPGPIKITETGTPTGRIMVAKVREYLEMVLSSYEEGFGTIDLERG